MELYIHYVRSAAPRAAIERCARASNGEPEKTRPRARAFLFLVSKYVPGVAIIHQLTESCPITTMNAVQLQLCDG